MSLLFLFKGRIFCTIIVDLHISNRMYYMCFHVKKTAQLYRGCGTALRDGDLVNFQAGSGVSGGIFSHIVLLIYP